jgi:hypothetical protein
MGVEIGPSVQLVEGCSGPNEHTLARAEGIERLLARYPHADNLDLQLFLEGFEAGEQYCISRRGTSNNQGSQSARICLDLSVKASQNSD